MNLAPGGSRFRFPMICIELTAAAACGGLHLPAFSQAPAPATAASAADPGPVQEMQSVTVTAQRRREPAREVPLTADVLDGKSMERGGYQSLGDVAALLPGVDFNQTGSGSGQSQVTMRGITTGAQVGATVSMYVDDVPFGSSSAYAGGGSNALDLGLFDLSGVEVLRGPQGTLYGAGAMGGLIKYVSVEPDLYELGGGATAELSGVEGGGSGRVMRGVVNAPLSEGAAALRATLYQRKESGFIRDANHGDRLVDGSRTDGGRLALLLRPAKDVVVHLTALGQDQHRDGSSTEDVDIATGRPVDARQTKRLFVGEPLHVRNQLVSAALDWDLKWATLDVISSWQQSKTAGGLDPSALYVPLLTPAGIVNPGYALDYTFDNRKFTQELRLTSPRSREFEWLAGAFFTDESGSKTQHLAPLNADLQPVAPVLVDAQFPSRYREGAVFGTGTYYLDPQTDFTLGVRRSHDSQHLDQAFSGLLAPGPQPASGSSEDVTTWMVTGRWRPASGQALYVRAASGYRPGGPLPLIVDPVSGKPLDKPFFKSDSLWTYELGWKGDVVPNRLSTDVALYQINWKDLQVFTASAGFSGIGNAGRARSRGLEWSLRAVPVDALHLAAALSVIDATLVDASPDLGGSAGERLPDTARLSAALQGDYDFQWYGRRAYVGGALRHTGDRFNAFKAAPGMPQYRMPAYSTIDLRAGIELGHAELGFFVRNLVDRRGQTSADTGLSTLGAPARVNLVAPRTIGLQLSVDFSS
jgi:iron complex outermembrane recepter protein